MNRTTIPALLLACLTASAAPARAEIKTQWVDYSHDGTVLAGLEALKANPLVEPGKIAIVGYCFGGTVAIELAETGAPLRGTVTIHGSLRGFVPEAAKRINGRVVILHGCEDPVAPMSEVASLVDQLRVANVPWQLNLYSGTQHGFSTPKNPAEQRANAQSKFATKRFFKDVFGL